MTGAKELAFSDPFDPEDEPLLTSYVAKKCEGYGVKYYIDKDLLLTKLFSTVEMDGQWVYILYADDAVLQEYLELKQEEKDMIAAGTYTEKAQIDLATRYGKLMAIAMLILLPASQGRNPDNQSRRTENQYGGSDLFWAVLCVMSGALLMIAAHEVGQSQAVHHAGDGG